MFNLTIIKKLLKERGMTAKELCQKIGITEQGYARMMKSNSTKMETLEKISEALGLPVAAFLAQVKEPAVEALPSSNYVMSQVPVVGVHAQAGYSHGYGDAEYIASLPTMMVMTDREFRGEYVVFEVSGDSMDDGSYSALLEGDKILVREVKQEYWKSKLHMRKWFFVIVHKEDGVFVKEIVDHDVEKGEIRCHSLNPMYEDMVFNLQDVTHLYNVISIVQRNLNH